MVRPVLLRVIQAWRASLKQWYKPMRNTKKYASTVAKFIISLIPSLPNFPPLQAVNFLNLQFWSLSSSSKYFIRATKLEIVKFETAVFISSPLLVSTSPRRLADTARMPCFAYFIRARICFRALRAALFAERFFNFILRLWRIVFGYIGLNSSINSSPV